MQPAAAAVGTAVEWPACSALSQRLGSHLRASASGRSTGNSGSSKSTNRHWALVSAATNPALDSTGAVAAPPAHAIVGGNGSSAPPAKLYDLVALSNLCVDIVVSVTELPPEDDASRRALLAELSAQPLPLSAAEVGGNTNTLISAARLGLRVASVGHVGPDPAGCFLADVLEAEGVLQLVPVATDASQLSREQAQTLLCFVLVDSAGRHAFCSRYDFG